MIGYGDLMRSLAPVSYWRLDGASGNALDSVGGRDLTIFGSVVRDAPGHLAGDPNTAITFSGGYAYSTANAAWALGAGDFSVVLSLAYTGAGLMAPFSIRVSASTPFLILVTTGRISSGDISAETWAYATTSTRVRTARPFNDGKPHHVVVTYSHTTQLLMLYVDGLMQDARVQTGTRATSSSMGLAVANNYGGAQYLLGSIDDVAVFNRLLTTNDVESLYAIFANGIKGRYIGNRRRSSAL